VPRLLALEKFIFDELVSHVWTHTLVPKVAAARARPPPGAAPSRRGVHEAALRKWVEALQVANAQLLTLGREGHLSVLQHQVGRGRSRARAATWVSDGVTERSAPGQGVLQLAGPGSLPC
jgi:hypothetical protein